MAFSTAGYVFLVLTVAVVAFTSPVEAFGAGFVPRGASSKGVNYRHGDILYAVYFLRHAHSTLVRQIYFGNWLRDFSQLMDRKALEAVPEPILRTVVAVFAYLQFGYTTQEFEVTQERLGYYRPEEHVDNPRGYDGGPFAQLRPAVLPQEHDIDGRSGMKNYIANPESVVSTDTSRDYVEKQLIAAVACGRARDAEAYTHLGAALHALEDFVAHSNWVELCMQLLGPEVFAGRNEADGMKNVFAFTGGAANVKTLRGKAPPLVTGTFGALDLYQTLLGEVDDKLSAMTLGSLKMRIRSPTESISSISKTLIGIFNNFGDNDIGKDIAALVKSTTGEPADWGKLNEAPELLWKQLHPIFRLRDKVVRWVYDHLTVNAVANAIATISTALDKLVYRIIGLFLGPVLQDISIALRFQADQLLAKDQQIRMQVGEQSVFDSRSTATDPTHSQMCKDHYDHDLNQLAGRVATKITTFTIKKVVEIWQPGSTVDVRPTLAGILDAFHHPYNYSSESEIQTLMVAEVLDWCTNMHLQNPQEFAEMLIRLERSHLAVRLGEETDQISRSQVPVMAEAYGKADQLPGQHDDNPKPVDARGSQSDFADRIAANIEKSLSLGSFQGLSIGDLPGIKQILYALPSADTPNPVDQSLIRIPGIGLLSVFEGIDMDEIVAAPGMGIILKDAVLAMRLLDVDWVEREQMAAQQRLQTLEDRPIKEVLRLLDFGPERKASKPPTEKDQKVERMMDKLKIGRSNWEINSQEV